jgi:hypothetical protein
MIERRVCFWLLALQRRAIPISKALRSLDDVSGQAIPVIRDEVSTNAE